MANITKFTDSQITAIINHNKRMHYSYSNANIDTSRSHLNYEVPIDHFGLSVEEYYKKVLDTSYIYGRGTKRETEAITALSWVITLPKELIPFPEKQRIFFESVTEFVNHRYDGYTLLAEVHNDEGRPKNPDSPNAADWIGGLPHIHIMFMPVVPLEHDYMHFRTQKTKEVVKLPSGRYEFAKRFKLDKTGNRIPVKNYAKSSDQYNFKLSAAQIINKAELTNFHRDLQKYLIMKDIEGVVYTGTTRSGGTNYTVRELKEFTKYTGLTLDQVKELMPEKTALQSIVSQSKTIEHLSQLVREKDMTISTLQNQVETLTLQVHTSEKVQSAPQGWGASGWGEHTEKKYDNTIHFEEDNL